MTAKRLLILVLLIGLGIYLGFGGSSSGLMASVTKLLGNSSADEDRLESLYQELEAKESILAQMDAEIERILANPPKPMCEGGEVEVSIEDDPRPELQEEIEMLREKISKLEDERYE